MAHFGETFVQRIQIRLRQVLIPPLRQIGGHIHQAVACTVGVLHIPIGKLGRVFAISVEAASVARHIAVCFIQFNGTDVCPTFNRMSVSRAGNIGINCAGFAVAGFGFGLNRCAVIFLLADNNSLNLQLRGFFVN